MTTALATMPAASTMAVAEQYLESFGNKLTKQHRTQFLQICQAFNLNPFTREVYGIPYGDKFSIIVGYEVYLKRAECTGQLAGWKAWTEGKGGDLKGCVEITRKDWEKPFYHEVDFDEYDQKNSMWKSKPKTMIKKVAIAQGFRLVFPVELGGLPYTSDEISTEPEQRKPPVTIVDTIDRSAATGIANELKHAKIEVDMLFKAFSIARLGEIKISQLDAVDEWIKANSVIDAEPDELPMTAEEVAEVTDNKGLLDSVYAVLDQLAKIKGDTLDDTLSDLTGGKVIVNDLQDKSAVYLNDIKMIVQSELAKTAELAE